MKTNFELVALLNNCAGNIIDPSWEVADKQMKIVQLEYDELVDGVKTKDLDKVRDGIADVLVTVYGLAHRLGLDADDDFLTVVNSLYNSLYSRFDTTEEGAMLTHEKYAKIGVDTYYIATISDNVKRYITRVKVDCVGSDGETYPKDKWLKSYKFTQPLFQTLPKSVELALA